MTQRDPEEPDINLVNMSELKRLFQQGVNIMQHVREFQGYSINTAVAIRYAYDLQAGKYTAEMNLPDRQAYRRHYKALVAPLVRAVNPRTLLDVGTGEATTLAPLLDQLSGTIGETFAFDISLSRLLYARKYLQKLGHAARLFVADIQHIPLPDDSVDVVLTCHAVEPNGGREAIIMKELLRITNRRLIMVEPTFELGSEQTRARIQRMGYVTGLPEVIEALGHRIVRHELTESLRADNQASLIVVDKDSTRSGQVHFCSPISGAPLEDRDGYLYAPGDGFAFPMVAGIPCLCPENGILASHLDIVKGD
jgi:ubiquinone/menaquinone biosynthesis C-methylase UbiE